VRTGSHLFNQLFERNSYLEWVGQHHTMLHERFRPVLTRGGIEMKLLSSRRRAAYRVILE
jgi:hypothetical protein